MNATDPENVERRAPYSILTIWAVAVAAFGIVCVLVAKGF